VRLYSADVIGSEARELRWLDISLVAERRRSATITRTGDCPNRGVRVFMGACPPSPAAATMARFERPGWSTGATFTQALSCGGIGNPNAPVGNGGVDPGSEPGETQERYRGKFRGDALGLRNRHGACFCRSESKPTSRYGAISAIRSRGNMRYGKAGERSPSQRPNSMMRCACGKAFDSRRLEESLIHVPHLNAGHEVHRAEPLH
jgi:hypothetical protein